MRCDDCESECCNYVEVIDGGQSQRFCCQDLPDHFESEANALIVRMHRDELSHNTKGFVLDWSE